MLSSGDHTMRVPGRTDLLALIVLLAVTAGYAGGVVWQRARLGLGAPNHDTYEYYYPNVLYQLASLEAREGIFWNRYQNCGQPFFAEWTGFLYPPALVFRFLPPHTGLLALMAIHLLLAGLFAYLLCREIGCDPPAALCGAFAFQLGGLTLFVANWFPAPFGDYALLPAALLTCERALRLPRVEHSILLGVVLSVQFLAGYPPILFYTYELLALRVAWEVATQRSRTSPKALAAVAGGMLLPVALVAVQLYPYAEFSGESLRARALTAAELRPPKFTLRWQDFLRSLDGRWGWGGILAPAPLALLGLGLTDRATRRTSAFYYVVAALTVGLAFETPLSALYHRIPLVRAFRIPHRFLWLTNVCLAVLTALGAEAVLRRPARPVLRLPATAVLSALGVLLMNQLVQSGLRTHEIVLAAAVWIAAVAAALSPVGRRAAALALAPLIVVNLTAFGAEQLYGYLPSDAPLFAERSVFDLVRAKLSLQERIYQFSVGESLAVQKKTASIFHVPSITDYGPQPSQRYQELFVRMMQDRPMKSINQYFYTLTQLPKSRALLNLLAARYVIVDAKRMALWPPELRDLQPIQLGTTRVIDNAQALPRAFFVPRAEVVEDAAALLERLASPAHDPRAVALVEEAPPGGGLGSAGASGSATIVADHSETLSLHVEASGAGFLFVSDQDYPGWEATVNGAAAPITRANYAFRLVRVPAGESTVVFRYRPLSIRLGKWVSTATVALLALVLAIRLVRARRWRSRRGAP